MKVFVIEASGKGGMIHYDYLLCQALQHLGVEATLITSTAYELSDLPHNFTVVRLLRLWDPRSSYGQSGLYRLLRRGFRGGRYIFEWFRLIRYLKKNQPEVVLFGEIRFGFERFFLHLLQAAGLSMACVVHDVRLYDTSRKGDVLVQDSNNQKSVYSKIYNSFDALFVHDQSNREDFLGLYDVPAERVHQIPLGTFDLMTNMAPACSSDELRRQLEIPPNVPVVLFFGTLTKYKGVEDLLRAFPAVHADSGAQLVIAGFPAKDINAEALKRLVDDLGITSIVTWYLNYVPNDLVGPLFHLADIIVLPYRAITQSAVLQIAYSFGRPVIGTRVGGLPEVIEEGGSGLLVDPASPQQLACAINTLLADPAMKQRMGNRARELAETVYSWQNIAQKFREVFEEISAKRMKR